MQEVTKNMKGISRFKHIRVGTRHSPLALRQTHIVIENLEKIYGDISNRITIVPLTTTGDKIKDKPLNEIGGKSLFIKEIEESLLDKTIDFAVHSMKDMPAVLPEGLVIGAVLQREHPGDALVARPGCDFNNVSESITIGTGSLRRKFQLEQHWPHLKVIPVRGNVETRIKLVEDGTMDAVMLATAGLLRLNLHNKISHVFDITKIVPAIAQGVIGIECRKNDKEILDFLQPINHLQTELEITAERAFMDVVDGSCQEPMGAYAVVKEEYLYIDGFLGDLENRKMIRHQEKGLVSEAEKIGRKLGIQIKNRFNQ